MWKKFEIYLVQKFSLVYGARAILLLFYDHQDNESESTNINTEKNVKDYMGQQYPYPTIWVKNCSSYSYSWS